MIVTQPNFNSVIIFDVQKSHCASTWAPGHTPSSFSSSSFLWSYFTAKYIVTCTSLSCCTCYFIHLKFQYVFPSFSLISIQLTSLSFTQWQLTLWTTYLCLQIFLHLDFQEFMLPGIFSYSSYSSSGCPFMVSTILILYL